MEGDVIFQTSRSSQSLAIQRATGSPYSHMGLILFRDGKPHVFEAVATVRFTPLDQWIARGDGFRFVVKRLKDSSKVLSPAAVEKLRRAAREFAGRPYDLVFDWSDAQIYCSELVWKAVTIGGNSRGASESETRRAESASQHYQKAVSHRHCHIEGTNYQSQGRTLR